MTRILAYGDSLTWGYDPQGGGRYPSTYQWPVALQSTLGPDYVVLADGVNGRTTCLDDHSVDYCRNAAKTLGIALAAQMPLDLVLLMLGTNDLKPQFGGYAEVAVRGMQRLVQSIVRFDYALGCPVPKVVIIAPPPSIECLQPRAGHAHRITQSARFATLYRELAADVGCGFFDAGSIVQSCKQDGIHLEADATRQFGQALAPVVREVLGVRL